MYRKILERNPEIKNASIMIVDDSEIGRTVIKNFFSDAGFTNFSFAENGSVALQKFKQASPDIIIADIFMPKMDGNEFIRKIKEMEEYNYIPIIAQTSSTESGEHNKAFESGASDVISKPIQKEEILSITAFHLENILFMKRIKKELDAARDLQLSMLPSENDIKELEEKYDMEVAAYCMPSSELSGDFWGFKNISHTELGIYMADITGHGVAAAFNTFKIQNLLNDPTSFFSSPGIFLKKLNKRMAGLMPTGQFSTMFYGVMNFENNKLQYASAAATGGIIVRKNGEVENFKATGVPLGVSEDAEYEIFTTDLKKGDTIILYSDALTETNNDKDQFLTQEEVSKVLAAGKDLPAKKMLEELMKKFREHASKGQVKDDLTINIYKRL